MCKKYLNSQIMNLRIMQFCPKFQIKIYRNSMHLENHTLMYITILVAQILVVTEINL